MENLLWKPSVERILNSNMEEYRHYLNKSASLNISTYLELHEFSIKSPEIFWASLFGFFKIKHTGNLTPAFRNLKFDSYTWFDSVKLNFAENLLKDKEANKIALNFVHESGKQLKMTYGELRNCSGSLEHYISTYIKMGDVVGAYMPNIPETIVTMLATTSLGAIFTSTSSDFGVEGVLDRFSQSRPKIVVASVGYEYGGKYFDQTNKLIELENKLDSLEKLIIVDFLNKGVDLTKFKKAILYSETQNDTHHLQFTEVPFSHPLYIMYSSGTTGKPKCIVHSQGGTLINHLKELSLHTDLKKNKKIFFFTTCGWMMWNWLVSSLYFGSEIVLYEGSPAYPSPEFYFKIIDREQINIFGTSPKFLKALEDSDAKIQADLKSLETVLSTGSPLLPEQYDYVYKYIKADVLLASISGGTDILGCFMLGNPILPVYRGEIQCLGLGMNVAALNNQGESAIETEGELVVLSSFPSRPIYFLNDPENQKLYLAYFSQNKDMWTHGDFIKITKRRGVHVYGRSDATLNPGGVRIGTAEIYRQTESLNYLMDSICVGRSIEGDVEIVLFVKMQPNEKLTSDRKKEIKDLIKKNTTPRHVPREIYQVVDIPYTRSGKKVELAVLRILQKKEVTNIESLVNPECLEEYKNY